MSFFVRIDTLDPPPFGKNSQLKTEHEPKFKPLFFPLIKLAITS